MDVLAVKQACKFAKEHALKNGPIVSLLNPQSSFLFVAPIALAYIGFLLAQFLLIGKTQTPNKTIVIITYYADLRDGLPTDTMVTLCLTREAPTVHVTKSPSLDRLLLCFILLEYKTSQLISLFTF